MLAACSSERERTLKPSPDWSRGIRVGRDLAGTIGLVVDEQAGIAHMVWPVQAEEGWLIHYLQMTQETEVLIDQNLDLGSTRVRTPRLLPAADGRLHLFFGSRASGGGDWGLWYAQLYASNGELVSAPIQISAADVNVSDYSPAPDGQGGVVVAWARDGRGDLFGARIGPEGDLLQTQTLLVEGGHSPSVRISQDSVTHLVWLQENDVMYAMLAAGQLEPPTGTALTTLRAGIGLSIYGPELGLDHDYVYVLWSLLFQSGTEAGTATTQFVSFPRGFPQPGQPQNIGVMPVEDAPIAPYSGFFNLGGLIPPPERLYSSDFVYQPFATYTEHPELAAALVANQQVRRDSFDQPVIAIFSEGQYKGYLNAGKTTSLSSAPIMVTGADGDLYMLWREGSAGQYSYFATTNLAVRALLDQVTVLDVANAALLGGLEGVTTMLCFPIAGIGWLMPGLILLGVWKLAREQEDLQHIGSWIVLLIAFLIYQAVKILTMPGVLSYVPFSAWIEVTPVWEPVLRYGVPLFILGLAITAAEFFRRRRTQSALVYYIILVIIDGLLTLGIYGVTFLGEG